MIVKDEAHIIVKTLTNLTKYIQFDYWVISDTGSTDTTKELIKGFFMSKNIPGELIETPWKDFGYNRTVALEKAYNKTDYAFVFDADDEIVGDFLLPNPLDKDVYSCQYGNKDGIRLTRPQLFNNRKRWKYVGVLHEYLESIDPTEKSVVHKGNYYFTLGEQGNRSKDSNKYLKDASVLEAAFYKTQNDKNTYLHSRYAYYCAQSYAGANKKEKALEFYKKTLKLEGWLEEKYVSCIRIFDMLPNKDEGIPYLIEASKYNKKRIECILRLVRHYSLKNMASKSYEYYKLIQNFFENDFYNNGITEHCLCINIAEYKFFLPYSMIIISDRVKDYATGIKMYEIIFKYSYVTVDKFYITNLISNLKFFYKHVTDPQFFTNMHKYIDLLRSKKFTIDEPLVKTYTLNINSLVVKQNITERPTICFIILTCEKYINTRLKWQLKTSLKEVPKKDIYAISCKMGKESYIYGWNTADDYDSLAMKYYMFIKNMDIHYDYYMFIDDDTFVFPSRVISWLSQYDKKVPYYMGCKLEYPVNITMSGGAGFILSNPAYKALRKHVGSLQEFNGILADRTMADWLNHIYYNNQTSKLTYICDNVFFNSCRRGDLLTCGTQHYLKEEQDYIDLYNIYTNKESKDLVIAILAKDKGFSLPLYLECIYKQTYPKSHTHLYIRTNDNKDNTVDILKQFIKDHESEYASVYFDDTSIDESLKKYKHHEWNSHRCKILGKIRQDSIEYAKEKNAHYFVADCDNFIVPETITELSKNSKNGIIAPMLNSNRDGDVAYSNYHYDIDKNGYLKKHDLYIKVLYRNIKGLIEVPVVHCTYFINNQFLNDIVYDDESYRYEYVIFSHVLRNKNIPQIIDNRQFYGIIEFSQTGEELKKQFETVWKTNSIHKTYTEVQQASTLTMQTSANRNFVFTSAGDNTNFDSLWINDTMDYDLYVIYYGNDEDTFNRYKSKVKFIEKRNGSKFQNFKYFYDTYPAIINTYDRFFILDDDIIFNVEDITNMFKLSREYKLDICAPSFSTRGYISHKITENKPDTILTYTNFVEVNVPLFSKKALDKLMGILDYSLIGWGIDYLYMWCNGIDRQTSYAIIHSIQCVNPNVQDKKMKVRELDRLQDSAKKEKAWVDFSKKINFPMTFHLIEHSSIKETVKINKKYTVVMLNFNRPNHTKKTLDKLVTYGAIDTIIVSNGNIEKAIEYQHNKVIIKNDADINNLHSLDLRFLRALDSNTDDVIIVDDDIQIEEAELYKILSEYEKNTQRIVGSSGRRNDSDNNYIMTDIYGRVDTVLTKLLVCKRKLAYLFFYCKPLVEHIYKTGIPYGNGEDILFSFVTNLLYDFKNYAISGIRLIDSGNDCFAVSRGDSHLEYRSKLNKYLYSNKELFYKHIDKFRFPILHEEPVIKMQILNKERLDFLEQKSRNLLLTMSLGADRNFLDITQPYMKQYADKYGADFIVLDDDSYPILNYNKQLNKLNLKSGRNYGGNSYYLKILLIHYYLEYYDKIMWLDDSCIVSPNTENIFDMVEDGSVGGCSIINDKAKPLDFTFIKDRKAFDINTTQYINSGIVIYTKKTRTLFSLENIILNKELLESTYPHQCYLNYMLQSNGILIRCLDNKYNDIFLHYDYLKIRNNLDTHIDTEYIRIHDTSIFHITGCRTKRQEVLKQICVWLNMLNEERVKYYLGELYNLVNVCINDDSNIRSGTLIPSSISNTQILADYFNKYNYPKLFLISQLYNKNIEGSYNNFHIIEKGFIPQRFFDCYFNNYARPLKEALNRLNINAPFLCDFCDIFYTIDKYKLVKNRYSEKEKKTVILRCLNTKRHWDLYYNKPHDIDFDHKLNKLYWRGTTTGNKNKQPNRFTLIEKYFNMYDNIDVAFSFTCQGNEKYDKYVKGKEDISEFLKHKYILSVEGNDKDSGLNWKLNSNSLVFMPKPRVFSWLMEDKLLPNFHYIQISDDFSDIEEKIKWCENNQQSCKIIIQNANLYMQQFKDEQTELAIERRVLELYFSKVKFI
jgi:hypothetical protein